MSMIRINFTPDRRTLRQFGVLSLVIFGALAGWAWWRQTVLGVGLSEGAAHTAAYVLGGLAAVCGVLAAAAPAVLRWLYVGLVIVSFPIGFVVSHVVLGLLYFGMFTPIALVFRLTGRDALRRAYDPQAVTYWIPREQITDVRRYFRQF